MCRTAYETADAVMKAYKNDWLFKKHSGWYVLKARGYALNIRRGYNDGDYVIGMVSGIRFVPGITDLPLKAEKNMDAARIQDMAAALFLSAKDKMEPYDDTDRADFEKGFLHLENAIRRFYEKRNLPLPIWPDA